MQELIPPQLQVFILSMMPVLELRFAIPYGIAALGMKPWIALTWALLGNITISIFLLWALDFIVKLLERHSSKIQTWMNKLFSHTRSKHKKRMSELGHLALFVFVAIPLPGSGAWSGSLVAYLFGVKKKTALFWISTGLSTLAVILTFGTTGIIKGIEGIFF